MLAHALAVLAFAWLALIVATPLIPTSFATVMYGIGSFICHQIPDRSFHLGAFQLPVCARCLGIYAGFAVAAWSHWSLTPVRARRLFMASALPTVATVGLEWIGLWRGTNMIRAVAGSVLGIGVALVVMSVVATLHYSPCAPRRSTAPSRLPPT